MIVFLKFLVYSKKKRREKSSFFRETVFVVINQFIKKNPEKTLTTKTKNAWESEKSKRNTEWEEIRWKSHYLSFISSIPNELNEEKKKKK